MNAQGKDVPYLRQLIGGTGVILLGTWGIALVMAWMPPSTEVAPGVSALGNLPVPPAGPTDKGAQVSAVPAEGQARIGVRCPECGVVSSTREIEPLAEGGDPGAGGGVTTGGPNGIPGRPTGTYEVTVRMADGSRRVFTDSESANWRPGERVIIIDGTRPSSK